MAPRPAWKGQLKLSLVSCAVELQTAVSAHDKISFRTLNRRTGNPVRRQYVDSVTGEPVEGEDEVKGWPLGDQDFLQVEEEEIEAVEIDSSHTLAIDGFVDQEEVEQVYRDTAYYLGPADEDSEEAFAVIREAMARTGKAGLARIVLYRRERPVLIEPLDRGLLLTTLHPSWMVKPAEEVFEDLPKRKVDQEMVDLAIQIIAKKEETFDPGTFTDRYEEALRALIRAKQAGRKPPKAKATARPANVVGLFDALKKSLAAGREAGRTARAPTPAKRRRRA